MRRLLVLTFVLLLILTWGCRDNRLEGRTFYIVSVGTDSGGFIGATRAAFINSNARFAPDREQADLLCKWDFLPGGISRVQITNKGGSVVMQGIYTEAPYNRAPHNALSFKEALADTIVDLGKEPKPTMITETH